MNESFEASARSTPRHLWIVGVLAVLWNSGGAFDYLMTETRNASYLSAFSAEQLAYFAGLPKWVIATWALGVWGGVLGSLLLLLRRRLAVATFGVSLAGAAATFLHNYGLSEGFKIMGGLGGVAFSAVILLAGVALLVYSRSLARSGVLR
jgi:hypothetical protein